MTSLAEKRGNLDKLNLRALFPANNRWGVPELERDDGPMPTMLAEWHDPREVARAAREGGAVHFFLDDYRFEQVWNSPERSLARVASVGLALSPDFSLWHTMPLAAQLWQVYRSRWVGAYWQSQGVRVIPTASWSLPESFVWCFVGIPVEGPVAMSAVGVRTELDRRLFRRGAQELLSRCRPSTLVLYGRKTGDLLEGLTLPPSIEFESRWDQRREAL